MSSGPYRKKLDQALAEAGVDPEQLAGLGSALVWRIGRLSDDSPVTVRLGMARGIPRFAELPRLRSATDQELEEALESGDLHVEWVGPRP